MAGAPHSGGGGEGGGGESSSPPVTAEAAEAALAVEETMGMMMISSRMTHAPGGSGQGVKPRGGRTRGEASRAPAMMRFIFMFCLHIILRVSLADLWNVFAWLASSADLFSSTSVLSMFASITSTFSCLHTARRRRPTGCT